MRIVNRKSHFNYSFDPLVPRLVEKCQGNRGQKLSQSNDGDYLLIKSNCPTTFLVNGEERTKVDPQYVHFNQKCLKEYLHRKHNVQVEEFPYERIIIDRETLNSLTDEECACLSSYGLHILWSLYFSFALNTLNDEITAWVLIKIFDHCTGVLNRQKRLLNFVQTNKLKEKNFHEINLFEPWHNITNNNLRHNHCQINITNDNCIMSITSCSLLLFVWISAPFS